MTDLVYLLVAGLAVWHALELWLTADLFAGARARVEVWQGKLGQLLRCRVCLRPWLAGFMVLAVWTSVPLGGFRTEAIGLLGAFYVFFASVLLGSLIATSRSVWGLVIRDNDWLSWAVAIAVTVVVVFPVSFAIGQVGYSLVYIHGGFMPTVEVIAWGVKVGVWALAVARLATLLPDLVYGGRRGLVSGTLEGYDWEKEQQELAREQAFLQEQIVTGDDPKTTFEKGPADDGTDEHPAR